MIQRIQTLYLLLVVILGTILCFFSPVQFLPVDGTQYLSLMAFDKWPLAVITVSIPVLALVNIFLFRRRLLQARLNIVNVVLCLGYYALLALYVAFIVKGYEPLSTIASNPSSIANNPLAMDWYLSVWAAVPLVNIVLLMMATRRILKDEALVRAADRLR